MNPWRSKSKSQFDSRAKLSRARRFDVVATDSVETLVEPLRLFHASFAFHDLKHLFIARVPNRRRCGVEWRLQRTAGGDHKKEVLLLSAPLCCAPAFGREVLEFFARLPRVPEVRSPRASLKRAAQDAALT